MFLKVTIVSLMVICAGGNPLYSQQSNHAISSQSFHRQDVPLSYNYSSIHVYTTPNPAHYSKPRNQLRAMNSYQDELDPILFKRIQYAPVLVKGEEKNAGQQTKVSPSSLDVAVQHEYPTNEESNRKDHLEPRNLVPNYFERENQKLKFIPGHNVEVLQSLRSPGLDTLYRSFPESLDDDNSKKNNNVHNHIVYRQPVAEQQTTSTTEKPLTTDEVTASQSPFITLTPELIAVPNKLSNIKLMPNKNLQESYQPQHAKIHRLHLNVARVYNIAQMPEKESDNIHPLLKSLNREPSHTQAIIYNIPKTKQFDVASQQKTYLFPVQKNSRLHESLLHNVFY